MVVTTASPWRPWLVALVPALLAHAALLVWVVNIKPDIQPLTVKSLSVQLTMLKPTAIEGPTPAQKPAPKPTPVKQKKSITAKSKPKPKDIIKTVKASKPEKPKENRVNQKTKNVASHESPVTPATSEEQKPRELTPSKQSITNSAKSSAYEAAHNANKADLEKWQRELMTQLNQVKNYPRRAKLRKQQGTVYLAFEIDKAGKVLTAKLQQSTGFKSLDQEALALIERVKPLPKLPNNYPFNTMKLLVPIVFSLQN